MCNGPVYVSCSYVSEAQLHRNGWTDNNETLHCLTIWVWSTWGWVWKYNIEQTTLNFTEVLLCLMYRCIRWVHCFVGYAVDGGQGAAVNVTAAYGGQPAPAPTQGQSPSPAQAPYGSPEGVPAVQYSGAPGPSPTYQRQSSGQSYHPYRR